MKNNIDDEFFIENVVKYMYSTDKGSMLLGLAITKSNSNEIILDIVNDIETLLMYQLNKISNIHLFICELNEKYINNFNEINKIKNEDINILITRPEKLVIYLSLVLSAKLSDLLNYDLKLKDFVKMNDINLVYNYLDEQN